MKHLISSLLLLALTAGCQAPAQKVDCSEFSPAASSPFTLPWAPNKRFEVFPHMAKGDTGRDKYGLDVQMPMGTAVLAIASGTVVVVRDSFPDDDHNPGHENALVVRHEDGTGAVYGHFQYKGIAVLEGSHVAQGDVLGYSGNTGQSTGPHLHLSLLRNCSLETPIDDVRLNTCAAAPISFRNASPKGSCGLAHRTYEALPEK